MKIDILAWQKARVLTKECYGSSMIEPFRSDFGLRGQLQRASVSTMANIAEGFERGGNKESLQFLSHAKGSCGEVRSDLYMALDQGYVLAQLRTAGRQIQKTAITALPQL